MKIKSCSCHNNKQAKEKMWKHMLKVIFPGVVLGILPKCPFCLAAYITLFTGLSITFSNASLILWGIVIMCLIVMSSYLFFFLRSTFCKPRTSVSRKITNSLSN
jgi:hypothetical protein